MLVSPKCEDDLECEDSDDEEDPWARWQRSLEQRRAVAGWPEHPECEAGLERLQELEQQLAEKEEIICRQGEVIKHLKQALSKMQVT